MTLQEDGQLDIEENITVFYDKKRQGIIRDIDYQYLWGAKKININIFDIQVPQYRSKVSSQGGKKSIRIGTKGKFLRGEHSYKIKYSVKGHLAAYEDFIEFYWNPIPSDWDTRIEKYAFNLSFSKPIDLKFDDYKILSGAYNSTENSSTIQFSNNTLKGRGVLPLQPKEGVTLAVKLPNDYIPVTLIAESAKETQSRLQKPINNAPWTWLVSALGLFGVLSFRNSIDGSSKEEKTIRLQYYPPDNMSAAQVGFFIDHKANSRDIMSLIPQWGAEGLIHLKKIEGDTLILKKEELPTDLPKYEHTLFDAIFKDGNQVNLGDLKYHIATQLYKAQTQLTEEHKQSDLYDETSIRYLHSWRTLLAALAFIMFGALSIIFWLTIALGVTAIIIGIILIVIYFSEAKHSAIGIRVKNHLLGLQEFLINHDGSEYPAMMQKDPKYFDKMFPYAVALGIDTKFLEQFSARVEYDPQWYGYHDDHHSSGSIGSPMKNFSKNFDVKEITSVFSSVKSQSGSGGGGFSGGGSVGGGFGGGGGSSW